MNSAKKILIVDDEQDMCELLAHLMEQEGLKPLIATHGESALLMVRTETPDVLILDVRMPDMDGLEVMRQTRQLDPNLPVIIMTAYAEVRGAIDAIRSGAHDYLAKPLEQHEVVRVVRRALAERALKQKIQNMSTQIKESFSLSKVMGPSEAVSRIISKVNRVAKSDFSVIITGETGSGKELVARAIHHFSHRSGGPFMAIDCGAIQDTLIESELFGYERGAFTGAANQKAGKLEVASEGTLFLDEVSNMTLGAQATLLRALQEKTICRVGGTKPFEFDVRLLVSSNQELSESQKTDSFRRDLFYRLNEFSIRIPPLRERKGDIPYLANRFLEMTNIELGKNIPEICDSAIETILAYDWPGNVRQLRATIRRAVLLADGKITEEHLDIKKGSASGLVVVQTPEIKEKPWERYSLKEIVKLKIMAVERQVLEKALKYTGGNKAKAARLLQIDYKTIHTKVKKLKISLEGGN